MLLRLFLTARLCAALVAPPPRQGRVSPVRAKRRLQAVKRTRAGICFIVILPLLVFLVVFLRATPLVSKLIKCL